MLFDVRGFNDSKTFWLNRLILIIRMSRMVKGCRHIDFLMNTKLRLFGIARLAGTCSKHYTYHRG